MDSFLKKSSLSFQFYSRSSAFKQKKIQFLLKQSSCFELQICEEVILNDDGFMRGGPPQCDLLICICISLKGSCAEITRSSNQFFRKQQTHSLSTTSPSPLTYFNITTSLSEMFNGLKQYLIHSDVFF